MKPSPKPQADDAIQRRSQDSSSMLLLTVRCTNRREAADLEAHLTYEEEQLVPVLNSFTEVPWARPGRPPVS